jgi:hypothetical protein
MQPEKAMKKGVILLRFCYWFGAILDARAAFNLTLLRYRELPAEMLAQQSSHGFGLQALWGAGDACALMWGWTALLIWADRKPLERRGVLFLTAVPVILLIVGQQSHLWLGGFDQFAQISFWFFFLIGLGALFAFAYFYTSHEGVPHTPESGRLNLEQTTS